MPNQRLASIRLRYRGDGIMIRGDRDGLSGTAMSTAIKCGCSYSLAVICGLFAAMALALSLAEAHCVASGGRPSDEAWTCEAGSVISLWSMVTPASMAWAVALGILVYVVVAFLGRRWLFR
jgi:hypothetical protein